MLSCLLWLLCAVVVGAKHFDGGTIRWEPIDPYDTTSPVTISITQSYWWSYPIIKCDNNVPITTSGRSTHNWNLTCVVDCSTDGGYSTKPISMLTDCTSVSSSLGMMTSQRSVNITLTAGAHFYLANVGSAWVALNYPAQNNLEWSIVTFIDLGMRPDGFINTPPVVSVVSPQYVIVNRTTQIPITVSDINAGDDVRCRWAIYTPGYRRRKRFDEEEHWNQGHNGLFPKTVMENEEMIHIRKKRSCKVNDCKDSCDSDCSCDCITCDPSICTGIKCLLNNCSIGVTTAATTITTIVSTGSTTIGTTTIDTPGTLKSTSTYPHRQAIDECGDICYPSSVPTGTSLNNCTLSFTGLRAGTWYAIAIQVEDFIDSSSTTPMSSVPVQFLVYVLPEPTCSDEPIILPLEDCLEVTVGVTKSFTISVLNLCNPSTATVTDIIVSQEIPGMVASNLTQSSTNASLTYMTFTWTPQANQNGSQQMCMIAYLSNFIQSIPYCITFNVITSTDVCKTTTTTTTTASTETTTTSVTTVTTSTTQTTSTTTATTTSTRTTSTTTTRTSTTTTTTTKSTTSTSSVSTTTTSISTTTTTTVAIGTAAAETTDASGKGTSWGLIAGILAVALPLALCTCCCLYRYVWSPSAKRQQQQEEEMDEQEENRWGYSYLTSSTESMVRTTNTSNTNQNAKIEVPKKSYQVYNILSQQTNTNSISSTSGNQGSILVSIYNHTNARRPGHLPTHNSEQSFEMGNLNSSLNEISNLRTTSGNRDQENGTPFSTSTITTNHINT